MSIVLTANMTPPTVLVNTYIQTSCEPKIDIVTKMFIILEIPVGVVRLPLLGNFFLLTAMFQLYALGLIGTFYKFVNKDLTVISSIVFGSILTQYVFLLTFNLMYIKKLQRFFDELNVFDKTVCCTPKTGKGTLQNVIITVIVLIYTYAVYFVAYQIESNIHLEYILCLTCHVVEVHFIGHLLSLIIPRLRLINYYMELSLSNTKLVKTSSAAEFHFQNGNDNNVHCEMEKLMNLYHTVLKTYTYLMEAIKWQVTFIKHIPFF